MVTKAQREAHRRYALSILIGLTDPATWPYEDVASILTQHGVFTPLGTTVWDKRLVAALLIWAAFSSQKYPIYTDSKDDKFGLIWYFGNIEEAFEEFPGFSGPLLGRNILSEESSQAVREADIFLNSAPLDNGNSSLAPGHQAAYRDFALDVIRNLATGPWTYGEAANILSLRGIPTVNGHTNWYPNQVERLLNTANRPNLANRFLSVRPLFAPLDQFDDEDPDQG